MSAPQPPPPISIAIIGAGIASLSLASALLHTQSRSSSHPPTSSRFSITIFESATTYPDYGAGLAMHANAIGALNLLHPELRKTYFDRALALSDDEHLEQATHIILAGGETQGVTVAELGKAKGRKVIARKRLLEGMLELLEGEGGSVKFGTRVIAIQEGSDAEQITLELSDASGEASTHQADCVIGADGVHSVVRKHLLGAEHPAARSKNHDGWVLYPRSVPMEEARELVSEERLRQPCIACGPVGLVISLPMNKGTSMSLWFVEQGKEGEKKGFDKERYEGYDGDVRAMAELVARHTETPWILQDHDPAPFYARGRIVMMGDAAHATLPFNGQGAAQAVEDAAVLTALFARVHSISGIAPAFAAFDRARRPRSQRVVEISRMFGRCYVLAQEGVGDDPQKMRQLMGPAGAFTNNVDLEAQNAEALRIFEELRKQGRVRGAMPGA